MAAVGEVPAPSEGPAPTVSVMLASGATGATPRHKTVAMPKSLPELRQAASLHFDPAGRSARVRMFHKGREMHHPLAIHDLKDGDEVVVKLDRSHHLQFTGDRVLTTHQADYVRHPSRPRTPPAMTDDTSTLSADIVKTRLEGQSSYTSDYPRHPIVRPPSTSGQVSYSMHFLKQAAEPVRHSHYKTHFPWHNTQPRPPAGDDSSSVLTDAMRGQPFSARSSYTDDYRKREVQPVPKACGNDTASTLTDHVARQAFNGQSQYTADYVKHGSDARQPSARPDRGASWGQPFAGDSEYRRQYMTKLERPPIVKLVPDSS